MKHTIIKTLVAVIVAAFAIGCLAGCAKKSVKQTASAYLDQDGNTVDVTVELTGGYSCDFARGAIYLYDKENKEGVDSVAIAMTLEKDTYDDYMAAANNSKDIAGGIMYQGDGEMVFLRTVGSDAYFAIFARGATAAQMESYIARFEVVPD